MKARVKATNKIVDIYEQTLLTTFDSNDVRLDEVEFLEGDTNYTPDYWEKLKHQYAGMAMNALLLTNNIRNGDFEGMRECNTNAMAIATALVEKLKGE